MNDANVVDARPLNRFLKIAVMAGVESAVQIHIKRGDDLNARDRNGLTPLMLSAARNKSVICRLLLDAGADDGLLAPSGETAFAIAIAAGAHEAAAIFESAKVQADAFGALAYCARSPSDTPVEPLDVQASEQQMYSVTANAAETEISLPSASIVTEEVATHENTSEFDLLGWEPEEDLPPPDADSSVAEAPRAIQAAITDYKPHDSSADWDDIDAYLPERSLPLGRTGDSDTSERLRLLILRAIREGSVPRMCVEALSVNDDQSANPEAEALLSMIVNDLGAETDERFEYLSATESFEVYVKSEESSDEEDMVSNALRSIDSWASNRTDPLRIFQKEFQRERLISAEEEVSLGKAMENALERALDALVTWPHGISLTLAAGQLVKTGQRPLNWLAFSPVELQPKIEPFLEGESDANTTVPDQLDETLERDDGLQSDPHLLASDQASGVWDALDKLASFHSDTVENATRWHVIRETLSSLRLNRGFLLELADAAHEGDLGSAYQYTHAMNAYLRARDQMTVANLKLVFHLAQKYQYSGEPLDDLVQAGNIGLMKAVDRFDWRRGFKFSTYATWWIRQQIGRHVADKCRTIRVPVHVHEKAQRIFREIQEFESETGRTPELDEIAARLGMAVHRVSELQQLTPEPLPIHELPVDELIAVEVRSDFASPDPMDIVSESELRRVIDKLLSMLKPQEEQVVRLRFGIGVAEALTLEEIGCQYAVTRERIRQIETSALLKLKHPNRLDPFAQAVYGTQPCIQGKDAQRAVGRVPEAKAIRRPISTKADSMSPSVPLHTPSLRIDRLLSEAAALGVPVNDDRDGPSGKLWVNVANAQNGHFRKLVRGLLALGFELCPGKGYWR